MALAHLRFAAMPVVTVDATDAHALALRGWGRYTARLLGALPAAADGLQLNFVSRSTPGPEFVWEQVGLARAARRAGSAVLHAPNCFLPLRRSCPGVVTVHDLAFEAHPEDFGRLTALKFRAVAPRAARSAERIICVSRFTAEDLQRRYGIGPERVRVIPLAPALPRRGRRSAGSRPQDAGPYVLGVGDLRGKKDFACLLRAWRPLRREGLPHRLVLAGLDAGEGPRLRAAAGRGRRRGLPPSPSTASWCAGPRRRRLAALGRARGAGGQHPRAQRRRGPAARALAARGGPAGRRAGGGR